MGSGIRRGAARQLQNLFDAGAVASLSDAELLARFLGRGPSAGLAFEALVERHGRMVVRVSLDVLGDSHEAQDAAQATFFILARKAASIRKPDALPGWLHETAWRIATRALRATIRRRHHERRSVESKPLAADPPANWAELHDELARLPDRYREPILLCDLAGLTHEQAAGKLGCPPRTLETRLYRGRERLKDQLIRRGFAPSAALVGLNWATQGQGSITPSWVASTVGASLRIATVGAWAAAGEGLAVAVSLAKCTSEELIMEKLKVMVAAGMILGVAVGGSWSILKADDPPSSKGQVAEQNSTVVLEAAPRPKDVFETAYSLAEGEDVKIPTGSAIKARHDHFAGKFNEIGIGGVIDMNEVFVCFRWEGDKRKWRLTTTHPEQGIELHTLLENSLNFQGQEIEGDEDLMKTPLPVDLLIRDGVKPEKMVPQLETILRRDFAVPIRLSIREVTRDVVVVRGDYEYKSIGKRKANPDPQIAFADDDWLVIYAYGEGEETDNTRSRKVGGSNLSNLFSELGLYFGLRIVNEIKTPPKRRLDWQITDYSLVRKLDIPEEQDLVLKHLSEQTGLTFQREKRAVRVLQVDRDR